VSRFIRLLQPHFRSRSTHIRLSFDTISIIMANGVYFLFISISFPFAQSIKLVMLSSTFCTNLKCFRWRRISYLNAQPYRRLNLKLSRSFIQKKLKNSVYGIYKILADATLSPNCRITRDIPWKDMSYPPNGHHTLNSTYGGISSQEHVDLFRKVKFTKPYTAKIEYTLSPPQISKLQSNEL
jgi:hypothetical protein